MARIQINDLKLKTIIGTHPWERQKKQLLILHVTMEYDSKRAEKSDDLKDSVDYLEVSQKIISAVEKSQFFLLERLGDSVLDVIRSHSRLKKATLRIEKPSALKAAHSISVELSFP